MWLCSDEKADFFLTQVSRFVFLRVAVVKQGNDVCGCMCIYINRNRYFCSNLKPISLKASSSWPFLRPPMKLNEVEALLVIGRKIFFFALAWRFKKKKIKFILISSVGKLIYISSQRKKKSSDQIAVPLTWEISFASQVYHKVDKHSYMFLLNFGKFLICSWPVSAWSLLHLS